MLRIVIPCTSRKPLSYVRKKMLLEFRLDTTADHYFPGAFPAIASITKSPHIVGLPRPLIRKNKITHFQRRVQRNVFRMQSEEKWVSPIFDINSPCFSIREFDIQVITIEIRPEFYFKFEFEQALFEANFGKPRKRHKAPQSAFQPENMVTSWYGSAWIRRWFAPASFLFTKQPIH